MPVDLDAIAKQLLAEAGEDADVEELRQFSLEGFVPGEGFQPLSSAVEPTGEITVAIPQLFAGSAAYAKTSGGISTLIGPGGESAWDKVLRHYLGSYGYQEHHFDNVVIQSPRREHAAGTAQLIDQMSDLDTRIHMTQDPKWWVSFVGNIERRPSDYEISQTPGIGKMFIPRTDEYHRLSHTIQTQAEKHGVPYEVIGAYWDKRRPKVSGKPYGKLDTSKTLADQTLMTRMQYGDFSVLFPGAPSEALQRQFMKYGGAGQKNTLMVVSPGWQEGFTEEFMAAVDPEAVIMHGSQAYANVAGRVDPSRFADIPIFKTGDLGSLRITSTGRRADASFADDQTIVGKPLWSITQDPFYHEPRSVTHFPDANLPRLFYPDKPPFNPATAEGLTDIGGGRYRGFVTGVEDIDTIKLHDLGNVRLIGINAPEINTSALPSKYRDIPVLNRLLPILAGAWTEQYEALFGMPGLEGTPDPYSEMGKSYMEKRALGRRVILEFDEELVDIYGRPLVYAFSEQGEFLNLSALELGLAVPMPISPNKRYRDLFKQAGKRAKELQMGLWPRFDEAFPPTRSPEEKKRIQPLKRKHKAVEEEVQEISQMIGFMPGMDYGITQHFSDSRVEYPV